MPRLRGVPGAPAYYLAATLARTGDDMVGVAVVLLVLERTGRAPLAGVVVAAYLLPTVISGPFLGAWLDRTRFRRAALAANQILLGLAMVALVLTVGTAPAWSAVAITGLVGFTVPMTSGGFTSLLPRFVPGALLPRAHALEGASFSTSAILGPAAAATLAAAASAGTAVLSITVTAALSLPALAGIPRRAAAAPAGATPGRPGLLGAVRGGLRHLTRTPPLRGVTAATSLGFLGVGMLTIAVPLRAQHLAGDPALGGYVWTAVEVGAVATALAWARWHARWRPERVVLAGLAGYGLVLAAWPVAGSLAVLLGLAVLTGAAGGAGMPALFTTRQRYTPERLYGQISLTGASLKLGAFAAGAAAGGVLTPVLGAPRVLWLAAGLHLAAAGLGAALLRTRSAEVESGLRPAGAAEVPDPVA